LGLVIAGALFARAAGADPVGGHFEITPFAGGTMFDGGARLDGQPPKDGHYLGARLGYQFHPVFSLEAAGGYTPTEEDGPPGKSASFSHLSVNGVWLPWGQLHGGPFLFGGFGTSSLKASGGSGESHGGYEFGGGWRLWMTDALAVRLEARQVLHKEPAGDGTDLNINHMVLGAGVIFALGGHPRDTDADRLPVDRAEHGMELDEDAPAQKSEFDVLCVSGRSRLAQALRERVRQARQGISARVMRVDRQSIEAGKRLVDAEEAEVAIAESQPDWNVPDGIEKAPRGALFLERGSHSRQLALARRLRRWLLEDQVKRSPIEPNLIEHNGPADAVQRTCRLAIGPEWCQ